MRGGGGGKREGVCLLNGMTLYFHALHLLVPEMQLIILYILSLMLMITRTGSIPSTAH